MTREDAKHIVDVAFDVPQAVRRAGEDRTYHEDEIREAKNMAIEALEQEPCEDTISRQAVLEALEQEEPLVWCDGADEIAAYNQWSSDVDTIKNIPSVQPKSKTGQWVLLDECSNSGYYCSECHKKLVKEGWSDTVKKIKYCPNCGAKMESEETDADSH